MPDNTQPTPPPINPRTRDTLAYVLLGIGAGGIITLGALVIALSPADQRLDSAKFIFGAILPLLGTWMGTVLAYYYSRESLAAATSSVSTLAKQLTVMEKLRSIQVKEKMVTRDRIRTLGPADLAKLDQLTLDYLLREMNARQIGRLIVLDEKNAPKYLAHQSALSGFIAAAALEGKDVKALKFADLVGDAEMKKRMTTTYTTVGPEATLADAKLAMEQGPDCEDVFITRTGERDGEVLGWITDNQISLAASA